MNDGGGGRTSCLIVANSMHWCWCDMLVLIFERCTIAGVMSLPSQGWAQP
jgi:hypothetical protein